MRDIITEKRFVEGDISTKYLPQVYPEGFKGKQLKSAEEQNLIAIAACVAVKTAMRDASFKQQRAAGGLAPKDFALQVQLQDKKTKLVVTPTEKNGKKAFEVRMLHHCLLSCSK